MTGQSNPHLSIVAVSRNDDHGGALIERMQQFVDTLDYQCRKFALDAELVMVEWNPPSDRPPLRAALQWPSKTGPLAIRIITVPGEIHARYEHGDRLPLYQMIGKNAGIRRARGEFVLATNIDIMFDDNTVRYLRDKLEHGVLLRADRFDVPASIPAGSIEEKLSFWRQNIFQANTRFGILDVKARRFLHFSHLLHVDGSGRKVEYEADLECLYGLYCQDCSLANQLCSIAENYDELSPSRTNGEPFEEMLHEMYHANQAAHMHACGDFTLLSKEDWQRLAAYPELDAYSWDLDSVLIFAAFASGIKQVILPPSHRIFHIDHSKGSGWTPEGHDALFQRLRAADIPYLADGEVYAWRRRLYQEPETRVLNAGNWGLANDALPELEITPE